MVCVLLPGCIPIYICFLDIQACVRLTLTSINVTYPKFRGDESDTVEPRRR